MDTLRLWSGTRRIVARVDVIVHRGIVRLGGGNSQTRSNIGSIADITRAEVTSAFARRAREGVSTMNEGDELIQTFRAHCATQYRITPTQPRIIDPAIELIQRHPLRACDAV